MDDGQLPAPRRKSTGSRRTTVSDGEHKKPASIYEINDLYSALQELVNSSPASVHRRRMGTGLNFDSSDSWTSGTDSPDVRSRSQHDKKTMRIVRSSSNITRRYSGAETSTDLQTEKQIVKTPQLKQKKLSYECLPIGGYNANESPRLALKKSKSDASRLRSKSSLDGVKTMAEKIRDQRLKFTQGLRRREMEEEGCVIEGKKIRDIDDLVEWAKLDIGQPDKSRKKSKKPGIKAKSAIESALSKIKPNCSESNLRTLEATSRLDRWYEKASAMALGDIGDDKESYDSYSGSESDEMAKTGVTLKKGKSLDGIDLGLGCFTPDDLLDKWMKQKKNSLKAEDRGRSASETSVEPVTPTESESSMLSIGKDDLQLEGFIPTEEQTSTPLVINRIIVSQPSMDESKEKTDTNEGLVGNLPNQPIFYIPNLKDDEESKTTVIYEDEKRDSLKVQSRPRSRSELNIGIAYGERDETGRKAIEKTTEKRTKSFGSLQRRASIEAIVGQEYRSRLSNLTSEYKNQRPRSFVLGSDMKEDSSSMAGIVKNNDGTLGGSETKHIDANANICQKGKKHDKGRKLSKLPDKLKTLLSGKKV